MSVVVPTHNRARIITRCTQSVWEQTYRPLELVVVDDGSADDTLAVIEQWRAGFPPPAHLAQVKVTGRKSEKSQRWETPAEWKARLGADAWQELLAWQRAHRWHPHQLRHNAGTYIRKEFGIEMASVILGHRSIPMTELYAEANEEKALEIIEKIG